MKMQYKIKNWQRHSFLNPNSR